MQQIIGMDLKTGRSMDCRLFSHKYTLANLVKGVMTNDCDSEEAMKVIQLNFFYIIMSHPLVSTDG